MSSMVNHPDHYNQHPAGIECIDVIEHFNFNVGSTIKYLWRAGLKSETLLEDLEKAAWYIQRETERTKETGTSDLRRPQHQMRGSAVDDDTHFFDYQLLPTCQYPVPSRGTPELETSCDAPAVARVWWQTDLETTEPVDPMLVCHEHLQHILRCERTQLDTSSKE